MLGPLTKLFQKRTISIWSPSLTLHFQTLCYLKNQQGEPMVPSFLDIILELSCVEGVTVYQSAQKNEWGIIDTGRFMMKVNELDPSDEFLMYYVERCSVE